MPKEIYNHKNSLKKTVPKKLIDRKKAGFNAPLDLSINKLGKELILEVLLIEKGLVDLLSSMSSCII